MPRVIDDYRRARARCEDRAVGLDEFAVPVPSMTEHIIEAQEAAAERGRMRRRMFSSWRGGNRSKAIYVACVIDGRSVSEVARMFGIPPNTVSQIKRRGMKHFQKFARPVA